MARINNLVGNNHVTCLHQDVIIPEAFSADCAYVSFNWGAMLGGGAHDEVIRPRFVFEVKRQRRKSWKKLIHEVFIAPNNGGEGWVDIRAVSENVEVWFKSGNVMMPLTDVKEGDRLRLRFVAEDCGQPGGIHGGVGFIDDVVVSTGCSGGGTGAVASPINFAPLPNIITPNGDGINDAWQITGLQNACALEFELFDRWGDRVFYYESKMCDGIWPAILRIWDGKVRSRRKKKGNGKRKTYASRKIRANDLSSGTAYYKLRLTNCHESKQLSGFMQVIL